MTTKGKRIVYSGDNIFRIATPQQWEELLKKSGESLQIMDETTINELKEKFGYQRNKGR